MLMSDTSKKSDLIAYRLDKNSIGDYQYYIQKNRDGVSKRLVDVSALREMLSVSKLPKVFDIHELNIGEQVELMSLVAEQEQEKDYHFYYIPMKERAKIIEEMEKDSKQDNNLEGDIIMEEKYISADKIVALNDMLSSTTYPVYGGFNRCVYCGEDVESNFYKYGYELPQPRRCTCNDAKEELSIKLEALHKLEELGKLNKLIDINKINKFLYDNEIDKLKDEYNQN